MIRRFCDICSREITSTLDGLNEGEYLLEVKDKSNLSRLGGRSGQQPVQFTIKLANCHNQDICSTCLQRILAAEFKNIKQGSDQGQD